MEYVKGYGSLVSPTEVAVKLAEGGTRSLASKVDFGIFNFDS